MNQGVVFWDVIFYSLADMYHHFRGTCRLSPFLSLRWRHLSDTLHVITPQKTSILVMILEIAVKGMQFLQKKLYFGSDVSHENVIILERKLMLTAAKSRAHMVHYSAHLL
jgi:hypothetical protein